MSSVCIAVSIVDCGSNKVPLLAQCVDDLGATSTIISPDRMTSLPDASPDAVIISGNPALIADTGTAFLDDFELLLELQQPVLGICYGHQVLGLLHGAEVSTSVEDRELRRIDIVQDHDLFASLPVDSVFQEDHTELVSVPDPFDLLATSSRCANEAMAHKTRPFFGVQFHPESSGAQGMQLLSNFLSLAVPA